MQNKNKLEILYINNKLNTAYLFAIISNLVSDFRKKENLYMELIDNKTTDEENHAELKTELANHYIEKIDYWFDKELLKQYINNDKSMRDLAKGSKISLTTIFHSLKKSKNFVKKMTEIELERIKENTWYKPNYKVI